MWPNVVVLVICVLVCALAFRQSGRGRHRTAVTLILAAGLLLRLFAASDRCLHTWDERYHALVARNLIVHPLTPTLFERPALPYDFRNWTSNHVWLEKGPVPLLAISSAVRLFGTDEFVVRLPSIVVSLLQVYLTFLIASLLFDRRTALLAAFFHAINGLLIESAVGRVSSDHVDTFFIFFIELAVWLCLVHIVRNRRWYVPVLIGAATGAAILCKWFPALLVYPVWISGELWADGSRSWRRIAWPVVLAASTCTLVVAPYLAFILRTFPDEAAWVIRKYVLAYRETVDLHSAPFYYYFQRMGVVFGELIYVPAAFALYRVARGRDLSRIGMLTVWWLLPLVVFSFAETKRFTYLLIAAPAFFILLADCWLALYRRLPALTHRWAAYALLILLAGLPIRYTIDRITPLADRHRNPQWAADIRLLKEKVGARPDVVVFNVEHNIEAMFYSGLTVYDFVPSQAMVRQVTAQGRDVIINDDGTRGEPFKQMDRVEVLQLLPGEARCPGR